MLSLFQTLTDENTAVFSATENIGTDSALAGSSFAIIDMGSNSFRLCIFKKSSTGREEKIKFVETCRMGEGFHENLTIQPVPMARCVETCEKLLGICRDYNVQNIFCFATATVREAVNRGDFVSAVKNLGLDIHILSGKEEALCGFLGACGDFSLDTSGDNCSGSCGDTSCESCGDTSCESCGDTCGEKQSRSGFAIIDIGGASTEIATGSCGFYKGLFHGLNRFPNHDEITQKSQGTQIDSLFSVMDFSHSFKVGAVRMTDMFGEDFASLKDYLHNLFSEFDSTCDKKLDLKNALVIGIGGTITSVCGLVLGCENYNPQLHRFSCRAEKINDLSASLQNMSPKQRLNLPYLKDKRKEIIAVGTVILQEVMAHYNTNEISASLSDNIEGYRLYLGI